MLRFAYAALSDVGLVRDGNEDAGFAAGHLQLVADGVGGAAAGEVASATTAYVVSALVAAGPTDDLVGLLTSAVTAAHEQLRLGVERDPSRRGMATTLTAVVTDGSRCVVAHVGDSRGYLLRAGVLSRLTVDHTYVQALVDDGQLAPEDVAEHPYRSVVVRSVEADHPPQPDVTAVDLVPGDRVLLCSDGLSDLVEDDAIADLLATPDRDEAVAALVRAALDEGGRDNVTCLVSDVEDGPRLGRDGLLLGTLRDPDLVVDPAAVRSSAPA